MANLLTTTSVLMCPHGGTVTVTTQNSQVMAAGSPLVRIGHVRDRRMLARRPAHTESLRSGHVGATGREKSGTRRFHTE